MSGTYIYEISARDNSVSYIKIGASRFSLEKRIEDSFNSRFDRNKFSYYMVDLIPSNISLAINLENYLINVLIESYPYIERFNREYFIAKASDVPDFLNNINKYVLEFYKNNMHNSMELSVASLIRSKRKVAGYTQAQLGEICSLRQATISELENGKIGNYSTLLNVVEALGIEILFNYEVPK